MSTTIQDILAFTILGLAVLFLIRKFVWSPNPNGQKKTKDCGGNTDCGCH